MFYLARESFAADQPSSTTARASFTANQLFEVVRHERMLIALCACICTAAALAYVLLAQPMYTSSASILLDTKRTELLDRADNPNSINIDAGFVESQVQVLESYNLLAAVSKRLGLDADSEFNGQGKDNFLSRLLSRAQHFISYSAPSLQESLEQRVVANLESALKVDRIGSTYVLNVTVTTNLPGKSARIANAVTEEYFTSALDDRFQATKRAADWLRNRSEELRQQSVVADGAVETFKTQNNLVGTARGLMTDQQLSDLNTQLVQAQAATAEARARLDRVSAITEDDVDNATVSDALSNPVITRLRAQYLDLSARYADLAGRYGKTHRAAVDLADKMNEIKRSIWNEVQRIASAYNSDYEIAKSREASIKDSLGQAVGKTGLSGQLQVQLRSLESAADAYRNNYNTFLDKLQQANQKESFPVTDARIISNAVAPDRKSSPKTLLILLGGLLGGVCVGVGVALFRVSFHGTFRSPEDVEAITGLKCLGVLPKLSPDSGRTPPYDMVHQKPFSRYAELVRGTKVSIDRIERTVTAVVIGVLSALPKEGKTTVAISLARSIALGGSRVLLIDGDLHAKSLSAILAPGIKRGLVQSLTSDGRQDEFYYNDGATSLDILPAEADTRISHSAEVLCSPAMASLLGSARERYRYIIIDLPALLSLSDSRAIAPLVDGFVMVTHWGSSSQKAVDEALRLGPEIYAKTVGVLLNGAPLAAINRLDSHKGPNFLDYYQ